MNIIMAGRQNFLTLRAQLCAQSYAVTMPLQRDLRYFNLQDQHRLSLRAKFALVHDKVDTFCPVTSYNLH